MIHASTEPCGIFGSPQHAWSVPHLSCSLVDRDPYFTSPTQHVRKPTMAQLLRSNCGANPCATLHKPEFRSNVRNFGSHTFERLRCPPQKKLCPTDLTSAPESLRQPSPQSSSFQISYRGLIGARRRGVGVTEVAPSIGSFEWGRGGGGGTEGWRGWIVKWFTPLWKNNW